MNDADLMAWDCSIISSAPLLGDTGVRLEIAVLDLESGLRSKPSSVDSWVGPRVVAGRDGKPGWGRNGPLHLPAGIQTPGAVLMRKLPGPNGYAVDYIGSVQLVSAHAVHNIPVESWLSSEHGLRVFFSGAAYLPKDTPKSLIEERKKELAEIQGTPETRIQKRKGADRIYWYQVYNDLGNSKNKRPDLGGSRELPYPRRLATNRGNNPDGSEVAPARGEQPWLPFDEQFAYNKAAGFDGNKLSGVLNTAFAIIQESADVKNLTWYNLVPSTVRGLVRSLLGFVPGIMQPTQDFENFADALAMFDVDAAKTPEGPRAIRPRYLYPEDAEMGTSMPVPYLATYKTTTGAWDFRLPDEAAKSLNDHLAQQQVGPVYDSATGHSPAAARFLRRPSSDGKPPVPGAPSVVARLGETEWQRVRDSAGDINDLLYFPVPRLLEGRPDAWYADEEYGRQMLAGFHPVNLTALKQMPEEFGSAIRSSDVEAELQGSSLEQLVASAARGDTPRLFLIDHWAVGAFMGERDFSELEKKGRVMHCGRALFYLRKNEATGADEALIPVAIELAHAATHKELPNLPPTAGVVYSRAALAHSASTLAVWRLAKAVFKSVDFHVHEVYSHFARSHAVLEPFLIALRRQLSSMHPVFKLMLPHFRYTLNINRNARTDLINANGIIERNFTPFEYALRLGAVLYGKMWTFVGQALPEDLKARGMLNPATGKPWLSYPFAEDALDMWSRLEAYFSEYLAVYYTSDQDVLSDEELQAWWDEVKNEGHPDLVKFGFRTEAEVWGFAGPIPSRDRLVRVLATIAWLASGHHAAVNFGQYDLASVILNASALVRRPMPLPNDAAYEKLVRAALGPPQEKILMTYIADPLSAAQMAATVQLLSSHSEDEQTLDLPNEYLVDAGAVKANEGFRESMRQLEIIIQTRNTDPKNWARFHLKRADDCDKPMPYTLLIPSSGAGVTMRGVPYSVSI